MATGFAYVPSTGDGLTVVRSADACGEVEVPALCCGEVFDTPRAYILHLEGHRWAEYAQDEEAQREDRPFLDDPFARDSCA